MRLFMNSGIYPGYAKHFNAVYQNLNSFRERKQAYLADRYGAPHILQPILNEEEWAFFTNGDDLILQKMWASEHAMGRHSKLHEILMAQIEEHRTEVFYNLDPMRYSSDFVRRLPSCVRVSVCWRAAPSPGADFSAYDLTMCNFPSIIETWRSRGWGAAYFCPAYDPVMDEYARKEDRPIDVVFVGGYSRHHSQRSKILEAVAALSDHFDVRFYLDKSRLTRLAESPLGRLLQLAKHRRTAAIQSVSNPPVFGRELYHVLGMSKIVINAAIDMAGEDRGNMRCYEAMGCGSLLLSDRGKYPKGMIDRETMLTYDTSASAVRIIEHSLSDLPRTHQIARRGHDMLKNNYGKNQQWLDFQRLIKDL